MGHGNQKDDAIIAGLTTRCSSAFALIASCWVVLCAQSPAPRPHPLAAPQKADRTLPSLFPTAPVWTLALGNQLTAPPGYDETRVYFAIEGDRLVAYELMSGTRSWLVSARPQMEPVAGGGLLFLVEPDALTALKRDGRLHCVAVAAGRETVGPPGLGQRLAGARHRAWRDPRVSRRRRLPRLAASTSGRARTHCRLSRRIACTCRPPTTASSRCGSTPASWCGTRRLGGSPNDILALDERLYAGAKDNFFYCLMAKDGRVAWRWRTGGDAIGLPVSDEDRVYFVSLDNVLRALDLKSGVQHWMRPLALRPAWGPVRAGSTIIVAGQTTSLPAFDMKDGKPAGELAAGGVATAPPHAFEEPRTNAPMLLMVTHDIAKGASASLVARSFEPTISPVSQLPNLVQIAPHHCRSGAAAVAVAIADCGSRIADRLRIGDSAIASHDPLEPHRERRHRSARVPRSPRYSVR